jgi:hypothetical protein
LPVFLSNVKNGVDPVLLAKKLQGNNQQKKAGDGLYKWGESL